MKKKEIILEGAVGEHKKLLKICPGTKHNELLATLKPVFEDSRKKGHRVRFNWLWYKARIIYRLQKGADDVVRKHVITTFIKRNKLKYRQVQKIKKSKINQKKLTVKY